MGEREILEGDENLEAHVLHVAKADGSWDPDKPMPKDRDEDKESVCFPFMDVTAKVREIDFLMSCDPSGRERQLGLAPLLRLFKIPRITHNFSMLPACFNLAHVIHILSETCATEVAQTVLAEFMNMYNQAKPYLESKSPQSVIVDLADLREDNPEKVAEVGRLYYALRVLAGLSSVLFEVYVSPNFASNKSFSAIAQAFIASEDYFTAIGQLHRVALLDYEIIRIVVPPLPRQDELPGAARRKASISAAGISRGPPVNEVAEHTSTAPGGDAAGSGAASTVPAAGPDAHAATAAEAKTAEKEWLKSPHKLNMTYFRILFSQINSALHHTMQGVLLTAIKLASAMATELAKHLTWERLESEMNLAKAEYIVSQQHNPLHTCLAVAFNKKGGLDRIFDMLHDLWEQADRLTEIAADESSDAAAKAKEMQKPMKEAMDTMLDILQFLTSPKYVHESPLTSLLIGKEKDRSPGDFFDPYEWLVDVRMRVLPVVVALWDHDSIRNRPSGVVRSIIQIIATILRGEAEVTLRGNSASLFTSALEATARIFGGGAASRPQAVVPGPDRVQRLVDMGFVRAGAEAALIRTHNNISRAVEWLLTHPGAFANAPGAIAQPSSEPAGDAAAPDAAAQPPAAAAAAAAANTPGADAASSTVPETLPTGSVSSQPAPPSAAPTDATAPPQSAPLADATAAPQSAPFTGAAAPADQPPQAAATEPAVSAAPGDGDGTASSAASSSSAQDSAAASGTGSEKPKDKTPLTLAFEQLKCKVRTGVIPRAIELPDHVEDIMFDVKSLLLVAAKDLNSEVASVLFKDAKDNYVLGKAHVVSNRLRLFALLLNEHGVDSAMLESARAHTPELLQMVRQEAQKADGQPVAVWVASALLLLEALISHDDEPLPAEATYKKSEPTASASASASAASSSSSSSSPGKVSLADGQSEGCQNAIQPMDSTPTRPMLVDPAARLQLVRDCVLLLKGDKLPRDALLSVLRVAVRLTRDHSLAVEFAKAGGVSSMFVPLKRGPDAFQGQQSLIIMILRHVLEDQEVLRQNMEREISGAFSAARSRVLDVNSYLRTSSHAALRSPEVFVDTTGRLCKLPQYDPGARSHQVVLKQVDENGTGDGAVAERLQDEGPGERSGEPSGSTSAEVSGAGRKSRAKAGETCRGVVPYLISELLATRHPVEGGPDLCSPASAGSDSNVATEPPPPAQSQELPSPDKPAAETADGSESVFVYRCFLMQCLAEMVLSYPSCKLDVLNSTKRAGSAKEPPTPSKVRSSFIQYILHELLPVTMTGSPTSPEASRRSVLSVKASSVMVA
ncbi:MAG: hypothetical protein BJ554DRAFT_331, partial [Olpidium bornovanus]